MEPKYMYCAIIVLGLGCHVNSEKGFVARDQRESESTLVDVTHMCNFSLINTLRTIANVYTCSVLPKTNSTYVQLVKSTVMSKLENKQYKGVYLIGHSYGGAVVCKVAELLNNEAISNFYLDRLRVATMGSIHISRSALTSNVNIIHYMHTHDVSIKCNKIEKKHNYQNVVWFKEMDRDSLSPKRKGVVDNILGTKEEWKVHNFRGLYYKIIINMLFHRLGFSKDNPDLVLSDYLLDRLKINIIKYDKQHESPPPGFRSRRVHPSLSPYTPKTTPKSTPKSTPKTKSSTQQQQQQQHTLNPLTII